MAALTRHAKAPAVLGNRRNRRYCSQLPLGPATVGNRPSIDEWLLPATAWTGPTLVSTTPTAITAFSGTHTYQLPTVAVGDRLVLIEGMLSPLASNTPSTDMSAWTSFLASEINAFQSWRGYTIYIADAAMVTAWSGVTVSFNSANGGKGSALVGRIDGSGSGGLDTSFDVSALSAVTFSAAPNSPSLTTAWAAEDTLWVTVYCAGSTGSTLDVAPTNYGSAVAANSAATVVIGWAWRQLNTATEDPGAFTIADVPPPGDGGENWEAITLAFRAPSSTLFPVNLAGAMASAGALTKRDAKPLTGATASAGALARQPRKALAGAMASAGQLTRRAGKALTGTAASTGALTVTRAVLRAFSGTLTSSGALTRQTSKPLAGAATSTGALTRRAGKALAGAVANAGTLATVKAVLRTFTGAMASAGALTRQTSKPVTGATTSAGALTRRTGKALTGALTNSGTLATARVVLLALAGAMASSGALARRAGKALAGATASTGALTRQPRKALTGVLTSTGALTRSRLVVLVLTGAMTSAGSLVRRTSKALAGTATSTGGLTRRAAKTLTGVVTSLGQVAAVLIGAAAPATGRRRAQTGAPRHRAQPGAARFDAGPGGVQHLAHPAASRYDANPTVPRHRTQPKR